MPKFMQPSFPNLNSGKPILFSSQAPLDVDMAPLAKPRVAGPLRVEMPNSNVHAEVLKRITPDSAPIPATAFLEVPPRYVPQRDDEIDHEVMSLMSKDSGDGWKRSGLSISKNDRRITSGSKVSIHDLSFKLFPVDDKTGTTIEFSIRDTCKFAGGPLVLEPQKNNVGRRLFQLQPFDSNIKIEPSVLKADPNVIIAKSQGAQGLWPVEYRGLNGTEFEGCTITLYVGLISTNGSRHKHVYGLKIEGDTKTGKSFLELYQEPPLSILRTEDSRINFSWQGFEGQVVDERLVVSVTPADKFIAFHDLVDPELIVVCRENTFCSIKRKQSTSPEFNVKYDTRYEEMTTVVPNQWVFDFDLPESDSAIEETSEEDDDAEILSQIRMIQLPSGWSVQLLVSENKTDKPRVSQLSSEHTYIKSQDIHVLKISRNPSKGSIGFCEFIAVKILDSGEAVKKSISQEEYELLQAKSVIEKFTWHDDIAGPIVVTKDFLSPSADAVFEADLMHSIEVRPPIFDVDRVKETLHFDYPYNVSILGLNPGQADVPEKWLGGPFRNSVWQGQKEVVSVGIDQESRIIRILDEIDDAHYYVPVGEHAAPLQYIFQRNKPEQFNDGNVTYLPRLLDKEDVHISLSSGSILITLPAVDMDADPECVQINGVFIHIENGEATFGFDRNANWESFAIEEVAISASHSILKINDEIFLFPVIVENTVRIAIAPYPPDMNTVWLQLPQISEEKITETATEVTTVEIQSESPAAVDDKDSIHLIHRAKPEVAREPLFDATRKPAEASLGRLVEHYHNNANQLLTATLPPLLQTEHLLNGTEMDDGMLINNAMLSNYKTMWSYPGRNEKIRFVGERIASRYTNDRLDFGGKADKSPFVWSLDIHLTVINGIPVPAFTDTFPNAKLVYRFPHSKSTDHTRIGTLVNTPIENDRDHSQAKFVKDPSTNLGWYLEFVNFAGTGQTVVAIPYIEIVKVSGMRAPMMGFYLTNTAKKQMPESLKKVHTRINKSLARDTSLFVPRADERYSVTRIYDAEEVLIPVAEIDPLVAVSTDTGSQSDQQQAQSEDLDVVVAAESEETSVAPVVSVEESYVAPTPVVVPPPMVSQPLATPTLQSLSADMYALLPDDTSIMFRLHIRLMAMGYLPNQELRTIIEAIFITVGASPTVQKVESLTGVLSHYRNKDVQALSQDALKVLLQLSVSDGLVIMPFLLDGHLDVAKVQQVMGWFSGSMEERAQQALAFLITHPGPIDVSVKSLALQFEDINLYGLLLNLKSNHADFFMQTLEVMGQLKDSNNKICLLDCLKIYDGLGADERADLSGEWNDFAQATSDREEGFGRFLRSFLRQHAQTK